MLLLCLLVFCFCQRKQAYEMSISDWRSDVLSFRSWRGGAPERVMVVIAILMVLLDRLLVSTGQVEYHSVDLGYLVIDLIGSAATIALALLAHRFWPMIVAVLHVLPLLAHISRALDVSMNPIAYLDRKSTRLNSRH